MPLFLMVPSSMNLYFVRLLAEQGLGLTDSAMMYVVGVLTAFSRSEVAYAGVNRGERPVLVDFLKRAQEVDTAERGRIYRHVGDLAMFKAGVFAASLAASRSYYVAVGEGAYGSAASLAKPTVSVVLEELSDRFGDVTDALSEAFS